MFKRFVRVMNDDKGATAIEYGLIAALIAVAAIGALRGIGSKLNSTFNNASSALVYAVPEVGTSVETASRPSPSNRKINLIRPPARDPPPAGWSRVRGQRWTSGHGRG
jgi:pilus assembly protein Flp/PilA